MNCQRALQFKFIMIDRSTTRESILRTSYVFNTSNGGNRSFISTAMVNDSAAFGDDLRKSRIQNLPSYKRTNLGENVQFIVVFQTIEIERLSRQVQVQRMRAKEFQRLQFNYMNYEVQIKEMTDKNYQAEQNYKAMYDEYENLNKISETLYHENEMLKNRLLDIDVTLKQKYDAERNRNAELMNEVEKWKNRHQASEKSKIKEVDDMRVMMESQRKSMIDRELRELTVHFASERSNLENEIRKYRDQLENRYHEIEDYKQKCQRYEILVMELRNNENLIIDSEKKLNMLNQELMRLSEILKDKDEENQAYRQREQKLNNKLKEQKEWEYEYNQAKAGYDAKAKEAEDWRIRASRLEEEVLKAKDLEHYKDELASKLKLTMNEVERLHSNINARRDQMENYKRLLTEKDAELSRYKNLDNEIKSYESKINYSKIENDRINGILKSRMAEIEDWKERTKKLEAALSSYSRLELDKKAADDRHQQQLKQNEEMKYYVSKLENDINGYRKNEGLLKDLEKNNGMLTKEIERLNGNLKNQAGELNDYRVRYSKIESSLNEYKNIEEKLRDYQNKIALLTTEMERLNDLLKDRNKEISQLENEKLEIYQQISYYKNYESKIGEKDQIISKNNETISALKRDIENWQIKTRDADSKARELENTLFRASQEKDKLSSMIKLKNSEHEALKGQYSRLEPEIRRKNELELTCQDQNNQIIGYMTDLEGYERKLKSTEQELEKEKGMTNEFGFKIIVLSAEIERLNQEGSVMTKAKSKEFNELQESYSRLQSKVTSKNSEIEMLINKISNLESRVSQMTADYNRILAEVQRSELESKNLLKLIMEYQDYATRIGILGVEIDRLRQENKNLDEDVKKMRLKYAEGINEEKREEAMNVRLFLMSIEVQNLRERLDQKSQTHEEMRKSILDPIRKI